MSLQQTDVNGIPTVVPCGECFISRYIGGCRRCLGQAVGILERAALEYRQELKKITKEQIASLLKIQEAKEQKTEQFEHAGIAKEIEIKSFEKLSKAETEKLKGASQSSTVHTDVKMTLDGNTGADVLNSVLSGSAELNKQILAEIKVLHCESETLFLAAITYYNELLENSSISPKTLLDEDEERSKLQKKVHDEVLRSLHKEQQLLSEAQLTALGAGGTKSRTLSVSKQ